MGLFDKIKQGLQKTSDAVNRSLDNVFAAFVKIDADLLEELEEALILSDVGAETSAKIVAEVEKRAKLRKITTAPELRNLLREVLTDNMLDNQPLDVSGKPAVILVIGVNGVGKTTSIGKLAARYVNEGKKVMLSAADTFRAAAADQLEIWAKRAGADIVVMDGFLHVEGVAFQVISYVLLGLTAAMMIYSAVKYAQIFLKILRSDDSQYDLSLTDEIRAKTVRDKRIKS